MPCALVSPAGERRFLLPDGATLLVGRHASCDLIVHDTGVSRRHAEVRAVGQRVIIVDLDARNGTWLNGRRVRHAEAAVGDRIGFGPVELSVESTLESIAPDRVLPALDGAATQVRERAMPSPAEAVEAVAGRRLAQLVAVAQRLGGLARLEELLARMVEDAFDTFDADRVAVLLMNAEGQLELRLARDRDGSAVSRPVPRGIAQGVAERQVSWLLHDAGNDTRVTGDSVVQQAVRSALAAPLIGAERRTLGVLYVDNRREPHAFTEQDLDFLVAYAGMAASAIEREQGADRLRDAARVRENFERYFTPQLAARIAATAGEVALGGDRRRVVVLFSDIRGFTDVAERLPPDQMAAQLNEYFAAMVACVFRHDGALDKFMGDALMAYWGAPVGAPDDADRAVRAALDMQAELVGLNERWAASGRSPLPVGIGINAGDAFVGNIGAPQRLEYTLIGDTVNIASRLCQLAGGGEVLISDAVRPLLQQPWSLRPRPDLVPQRHHGAAVTVLCVEHDRVQGAASRTDSPPAHHALPTPPPHRPAEHT